MSSNTPPPGHDNLGQSGQPTQGQPPYGASQQPGYGQGGFGTGAQGQGGFGTGAQGQGGSRPEYLEGGPGSYGPGGPGGPGAGGFGPDGPGEPPSGAPARVGAKAVIIAAVLVLVLGGGAFAFYKADPLNLFTAGPQASEALPADALFYVGVDLDPSAQQKINALRFLNHFPAFQEAVGIQDANDDIRRVIFDKAMETAQCPELTYDDDIKTWLGDKIGIAGMPSTSGDPDVVIALKVSDSGAAKDGVAALEQCGGAGQPFGTSFVGDYMLMAETQQLADKFADSAKQQSLADSSTFSADMDSLGNLGVATMWVNGEGIVDMIGSGMVDPSGISNPADLESVKDSFQSAAATFRFESDSVEVAASVHGNTQQIDHADNQIVDLPDSTAFAISEAGGAERLDVSWDQLMNSVKQNGLDIEAEISDFEAQTGLTLPDDLSTVLGDNIMLAVDSEGLTADTLESGDPSTLNLGARFTNDPAELNSIYDKLIELAQSEVGSEMPFTKKDFEDGIVIASNDGYADQLGSLDGGLGDSQAFQSVIDDAADQEFVLFFNWDSVEGPALEAAANSGAPQEVIDNIRPLQALGYSAHVDGDYVVGSLQISVND